MAGPDLKNTGITPIGFADILIDLASQHITSTDPVLTHSEHSLGAMANTAVTGEVPLHNIMGGNPQRIAEIIPVGESFGLEISFIEKSIRNIAFAAGLDPNQFGGGDNLSGEIQIGNITAPVEVRVEAHWLLPDGINKLVLILPRAQVQPNLAMGSAADAPVEKAVVVTSLPADSTAPSGGNAVWDAKPLGVWRFKLD